MSHPRPAMSAAIGARFLSDTGTGGLFNAASPLITDVRQTFAPAGTLPPYVVFSYQNFTNDDLLGKRGYKATVKVDVFVAELDDSGNLVGLSSLDQINERVIGNWAPSGTAPTYGLHGWNMGTIATSWNTTIMHHESSMDLNEPGMLHSEHLFSVGAYV